VLVLTVFFILQFTLIVSLLLLSKSRYKTFVQEHRSAFQFSFMAPASLCIIEKLRLIERFSGGMTKIHQQIIFIYGHKVAIAYSKLFIAQVISASMLTLLVSTFFGLASKDEAIFYFGLFLTILIPILLVKELEKKSKKKKDQIIMELPEFLNKVTLLVNAGETVQKSIIRCVEQKKNPEKSFLYKELLLVVNELKNNYSFQQVLEDFNKRCAIQEVSVFTTTVLLNYRRGGTEFVTALSSLSRELWEKRKALTRSLGEQASSKLVFPMVLIFLVVMLIIATPAIMLF
jgi:tight adherence protein C